MGIVDAEFWCGSGETRIEVATDLPVRGGWFVRAAADGAWTHRSRLEAAPGGAAATIPGPERGSVLTCPRDPHESWLFAVTGAFGRVVDCVAEGADPGALLDPARAGPRPRWVDRCRVAPTPPRGPLPPPTRPPLPPPAPDGRLDDWGAACAPDDRGELWATFSGGPADVRTGLVFGQRTGFDLAWQPSTLRWARRGEGGRLEVGGPSGTSGPEGDLTCDRALDPEDTTWVFAVADGERVVDCLAVGHDPVGLLAGAYDDRREGPPPPPALRAAFAGCRVRWGEPAAGLPFPRRPLRDPEPGVQVAPGCPLPVRAAPSTEPVVAVLDGPDQPAFLTVGGGARPGDAPDTVRGGGLPPAVDVAVVGGVAWRLDREALVRIEADGTTWRVPLPLGPDDRAYDHVLALRDGRIAVWGVRNQVTCATNNRFDLAIFDGAWTVDRDVLHREDVTALVERDDGTLVGVGSTVRPWVDHAFGAAWAEGDPPVPEVERPSSAAVRSHGHAWTVEQGGVLRDGAPWWRPTPSPGPLAWRDATGGAWFASEDAWTRVASDGGPVRLPGRVEATSRYGVLRWLPGPAVGWGEDGVFDGPPGEITAGAVGPGGAAVALAEAGTWVREGGRWRLDPRSPPPHAWVPGWAEDGPLLVNRDGVWRWADGWVRVLDVFDPWVSGPRLDALLVVPGAPDDGGREPPFLWDGATRSPVHLPSAARSGGGGPGAWWIGTADGGFRWTDAGWRRWWSGPGPSGRELATGDLLSTDGEWVLPACATPR